MPWSGVAQDDRPYDKTRNPAEFSGYSVFGTRFEGSHSISASQMLKAYEELQIGDTLQISFGTKVNSVCKSKGCWMRLDMGAGEETMVKFKDYAFFVPKDIEGKEVIVRGKAFIAELSVEDQRHYAKDGGATAEDIEKITEPKRTWSFLADGVLIESEIEERDH